MSANPGSQDTFNKVAEVSMGIAEAIEDIQNAENPQDESATGAQPTQEQPGDGFGELPNGGNIEIPNVYPTVNELVHKLMRVPNNAYHGPLVNITLKWVKAQIGEPHFVHKPEIHRMVLKENSKLRKYGLAAGLPKAYYDFLCGNNLMPADLSLHFNVADDLCTMNREALRIVPLEEREESADPALLG